ncbi:MAG: hypothetical protein ACUZ8E_06320 [Candidatus Anammoxibacter sp.]
MTYRKKLLIVKGNISVFTTRFFLGIFICLSFFININVALSGELVPWKKEDNGTYIDSFNNTTKVREFLPRHDPSPGRKAGIKHRERLPMHSSSFPNSSLGTQLRWKLQLPLSNYNTLNATSQCEAGAS